MIIWWWGPHPHVPGVGAAKQQRVKGKTQISSLSLYCAAACGTPAHKAAACSGPHVGARQLWLPTSGHVRCLPLRRAPGERLQAKQNRDTSGLVEGVSGLNKGPARTGGWVGIACRLCVLASTPRAVGMAG